MKHFLAMVFFAALVSVIFGVIGRDQARGRALYGLKIFAEFIGVGLILAWILYWIPN